MAGHLTIPPRGFSLTRERLTGLPRTRIHGGRNVTKATVEVVEVDGRQVVVKDLAGRPWPVRAVLGPWQLEREARAYRRLEGIPGIPGFLGRPDRQSIALEFVPGRTLQAIRPGELEGAFFDRLERLVAAMHDRGVAHGDLHHRDVVAGPAGAPYLLDFSTSLTAGPRANPLRRFLFKQMCRADLRSVAKLRRRLAPGPRRDLPPRPALYRIGSRVRRILGRLRRGRPPRGGAAQGRAG